MDRRAEQVSRHSLAMVGTLGVIVTQVSSASLWENAVAGLPIVAVDVVLLGAALLGLLAGRRLAGAAGQVAAAGRSGPFGVLVAVAAAAGGLIGLGSLWLALQPAAPGCGSLLVPVGGSCGTLPGAGSVVVTAVLGLGFGGLVLGCLGAAAGVGPGVTVATWPKFAFWAAGVLLVGSLVVVPRSVGPVPAGPGGAGSGAGTTGASAAGSIASEVGGDLRLAVALLVGALALLAAIGVARRRPDGRMPLTVLPVALASSAVAGVAVAVVWQAVVWSGLFGG